MPFEKCRMEGVYVFTPRVFEDERGYFFESFNRKEWMSVIPQFDNMVQDNQAKSSYGVVRGLHYQVHPHGQTKIIRVMEGEILDVIVDLRLDSSTYGEHYSIILSDLNKKQLLVPQGFAHGYASLSETCVILYKCDDFYTPTHEAGIKYNDPELGIDWMIDKESILVSERDTLWPDFSHHKKYHHE